MATGREATDGAEAGVAPARGRLPFGLLAFAGALGSLLACYGSIIAESFLDIRSLGFDPHLQAVVMWSLAGVSLAALWFDRRRHGRVYPLAAGIGGGAVLLFALYVRYDERVEVLAYVLLFVGALLNQRAMIDALYEDVRGKSARIESFNRTLEGEVERQVGEIRRLSRLRDFLAPSVVDLVIAGGSEALLESHRRYVACLMSDIRNFTAFSEASEPEEAIDLLRRYHERVGALVAARGGTIGQRSGDGVMVIFNDPVPCETPVLDAVRLALDIRADWPEICRPWARLGHELGLGLGIAGGYVTLGLLGDEGRSDYTAIGKAVNLAARLCDRAGDGDILIDRRAFVDVETEIEAEPCEALRLKGFAEPVDCYRVVGLRPLDGDG